MHSRTSLKGLRAIRTPSVFLAKEQSATRYGWKLSRRSGGKQEIKEQNQCANGIRTKNEENDRNFENRKSSVATDRMRKFLAANISTNNAKYLGNAKYERTGIAEQDKTKWVRSLPPTHDLPLVESKSGPDGYKIDLAANFGLLPSAFQRFHHLTVTASVAVNLKYSFAAPDRPRP